MDTAAYWGRMKLIVGLGNPDRQFTHSRHNVGFRCVDHLARKWGIRLAQRRLKAVLGQCQVEDRSIVLAKLRTYMNKSGEGVEYLLTRFNADPSKMLVIYDDMDLPVGKIRIRPKGSAAGHNGIKSIISTLGTHGFPRIRVGIGRPDEATGDIGHVLGPFSSEERLVMTRAIVSVGQAVTCVLQEGLEAAMNRFN